MGGSRSGRYGSGRPIAEGLRRFDLAEHASLKGNERPGGAIAVDITVGSLHARAHLTETATRFGGRRLWVCCPRCVRRCRVLFIGFGRIACRRCFRLRYHSQSLDRTGRALHAMGRIAKQIDPEAESDLPDKPPGMYWSRYNRLAKRFENQSNVWNLAMMNRIAFLMPRLQRRSALI
jgi:hypothetical protein